MVEGFWLIKLNDNESKEEENVLSSCNDCNFYPCEVIEELNQYTERHKKDFLYGDPKNNYILKKDPNTNVYSLITVDANKGIIPYDQEHLMNKCNMSRRFVEQVECGSKKVTDGIRGHYKIEMSWDHKIESGTTNRWEPSQPVFISAQTGQGKNYFVEKTLIPFVRNLNYEYQTKQKVLIISNRLALKCQINDRLKENDDMYEGKEGMMYHYEKDVDVITYQSLLCKKGYFERVQKDASSRYIFVICDEAHFFTSDAMFNPDTQKILFNIVRLFRKAIRVYMSATPYECLEYIIKYEKQYLYGKYTKMVFYHFKRDYQYLNVNTYSDIKNLYVEIIMSVDKGKKWLIFIDDKQKCKNVKSEIEECGRKYNISMFFNSGDTESSKIYVVDAESKGEEAYISMIKNEKLDNGIYVLITTSVLDNGVNLTGIDNIVVSDMSKVKCLQMVGRARWSKGDEQKNLYIKRFNKDYVKKRMYDLNKQKEAYHEFELAYGEANEPVSLNKNDEFKFLNKYYDGDEKHWRNAKRWFGRTPDNPEQLYLNVIAKDLVDKYLSSYEAIYQEMDEESKQSGTEALGQNYLEYQLSWFDKEYCADNDVTLNCQRKEEKEFLNFLNMYAEEQKQLKKEEQKQFTKEFTQLHDVAFPRKDKNKGRYYGINKMNKILKDHNFGFKVDSESTYWKVIKFDWLSEKAEP